MKKQIAFFDFDGTVTTKDTLLEFIKFSKGTLYFYLGFLLYSPYLIAFKLKLISNQLAKEKVLRFFFRKTPITIFQRQCQEFAVNALPSLLRPKALHEIARLKHKGVEVVIVSASPENWIKPWTDTLQIQLIATRLKRDGDYMTGCINERNCHGEEKVRRIKEQYDLNDYANIMAYGDSTGDKPMLQLAAISFYKPFR